MRVKIYDNKSKQFIWVKVSKAVKDQIIKDNKEEQSIREQKKHEVSLDKLIAKGVQFADHFDIEKEVAKRERERKIINSNDYKKFRGGLQESIKRNLYKMSDMEKKAMFLRFFKDMSISAIAEELGITRGSAQSYLQRGCKKIKKYLEADLENQRKITSKKRKV